MAENHERDLGRVEGTLDAIGEHLKDVDRKLDNHIKDEEDRLTRIEHQLSLARFLYLFLKAATLTLAFVLAFKFGDIRSLWDFNGK